MTAQTTRLYKEVRLLWWPLCIISSSLLLPLASRQLDSAPAIAFFCGIPLLACLTLGNEFQYRTLPLLLSQPVPRQRIWSEKLGVMSATVLLATAIFYTARPEALEPRMVWVGLLWPVACAGWAMVWTQVARGSIGGFGFTICTNGLLFLAALPLWLWAQTHLSENAQSWLDRAGLLVLAGYIVAGLWLSRRILVHFEMAGGMGSDDLQVSGPTLFPQSWTERFRSRPGEPLRNLVRKELRLLRPLWLTTLLVVAAWLALTLMLRLAPKWISPTLHVAILGITCVLIPLLAGSMSVGEDRSSGAHAWHLTLPVSPFRQWVIKLTVAILAALLCGVLLPSVVFAMAEQGWPIDRVAVLTIVTMTLVSFWCACAVNGTVWAALCVFPVMNIMFFAAYYAAHVDGLGASLFHFLARHGLPFGMAAAFANQSFFQSPPLSLRSLAWYLPAVIIVLGQSLRHFRRPSALRNWEFARAFALLVTAVFLGSLGNESLQSAEIAAWQDVSSTLYRVQQAVAQDHPDILRKVDTAHPLEMPAEDVLGGVPMPESSRRWLQGARVVVIRVSDDAAAEAGGETLEASHILAPWYTATIHLSDQSTCPLLFTLDPRWLKPRDRATTAAMALMYGRMRAKMQRRAWPCD